MNRSWNAQNSGVCAENAGARAENAGSGLLSPRWQTRFTIVGLMAIGAFCGVFVNRWISSADSLGSAGLAGPWESFAAASSLKTSLLDSASGGKKVSLATGLIEDGTEGLFALDHETAVLYCWVLDPRNGNTIGQFTANVGTQMGLAPGGDLDFVMTTGALPFQGGRAANARPINSVVYVAEGNSGKVVGLSLGWNQTLATRSAPQEGLMNVVFTGTVRGVLASRDQ